MKNPVQWLRNLPDKHWVCVNIPATTNKMLNESWLMIAISSEAQQGVKWENTTKNTVYY